MLSRLADMGDEICTVAAALQAMPKEARKATAVDHSALLDAVRAISKFRPAVVSKGFLKMVEILKAVGLTESLTKSQDPIGQKVDVRTASLCELPGSYLAAIVQVLGDPGRDVRVNSLMSSLYNCEGATKDVHGIHLAPYKERFVGGDITLPAVRQRIELRAAELWGDNAAALVTADGYPNLPSAGIEKGSTTAREQFYRNLGKYSLDISRAEVAAAFALLAPGGALVLKIVDLFRWEYVAWVDRLACSFEEAHLIKPRMSGDTNSEVYFVGRGFRARAGDREWARQSAAGAALVSPRLVAGNEIRVEWADALLQLHTSQRANLHAHIDRARAYVPAPAATPAAAAGRREMSPAERAWFAAHEADLSRRPALLMDAPKALVMRKEFSGRKKTTAQKRAQVRGRAKQQSHRD